MNVWTILQAKCRWMNVQTFLHVDVGERMFRPSYTYSTCRWMDVQTFLCANGSDWMFGPSYTWKSEDGCSDLLTHGRRWKEIWTFSRRVSPLAKRLLKISPLRYYNKLYIFLVMFSFIFLPFFIFIHVFCGKYELFHTWDLVRKVFCVCSCLFFYSAALP